ncbi:MAG: MYG1 family protein [Patescibacteria group bacterium]|nr:MYG1 family protein [Patescibacteria group bacterium]
MLRVARQEGTRMKIGTHDGRFHSDETFSVAALLLVYPDAEVVRTRDEDVLATCDIRVDVGRKYDPATGDYDHHQALPPRANGIKYSSLGIIWNGFGVQGRAMAKKKPSSTSKSVSSK